MTINERLKRLIEALKMNPRSFSERIGVKDATTRSYLDRGSKPSSDYLGSIARAIAGLNPTWLLTGEGDMFYGEKPEPRPHHTEHPISIIAETEPHIQVFASGTDKKHDLQLIPLYDITAAAGLSALHNSQNNILDFISIPNLSRCDGAIYVKGDSMYPLIKHGSIVAFQQVQPDDIYFGEIYVVDISTPSREKIVVKYVQKSEKGDEYVKLVSYNEKHHPPKDIHISKIRAIAEVRASILVL